MRCQAESNQREEIGDGRYRSLFLEFDDQVQILLMMRLASNLARNFD
jgi:hypothetical protein